MLTAASYVLQAYFVQIGMPRGRPPGSKKPSLGAAARAARWKSKTPDQKSDTPNDSRPPELANILTIHCGLDTSAGSVLCWDRLCLQCCV